MAQKDLESRITAAVMQALKDQAEFSNVARPKATKASTATQGAWNIDDAPKASSATQGSWDSTDTPGGVAARSKKVWTKDELAAEVRKVVMANMQFFNRPIEGEAKPSAVKAVSGETPSGKVSTATRASWDSTDTPGGVSSESKKVWTKDQIAAEVAKVLMSNAEFRNIAMPGPVREAASKVTTDTYVDTSKTSASTGPAYKAGEVENKKKMSASVCAQILTNVYKLK